MFLLLSLNYLRIKTNGYDTLFPFQFKGQKSHTFLKDGFKEKTPKIMRYTLRSDTGALSGERDSTEVAV